MNTTVLDRFPDITILCVGDLMLDRFVYGDAARISPEAPIPVIRQTRVLEMLGGVGNAARNIRALGAKVHLIGVTGADMPASDVRSIMAEEGMDDSRILTDPSRRTVEKIRIIARQQQMLRLDAEDTQAVSEELEEALCRHISGAADTAQAVILSDYGKGVLTKRVIAHAIKEGKRKNIPVLVDPKGADYTLYKGATLVTPNLAELTLATGGAPLEGDEAVTQAARKLIKSCDLQGVVATRSKDGMSVVEKNASDATHLPTRAREVFDVSGAGDTVIAALALGLAAGMTLPEAAYMANCAGGVVVAKLGTATLSRNELAMAMAEGPDRHDMILDWTHAAELTHQWRARGLKVVTTNGAFDILHEGHVTLLQKAKSLGDRLIVLLNSDASIKRYKSKDRPINPESARAKVMAALGAVDAVVVFGDKAEEDDKPLKLIELLKPDIHVKGGDYKLEDLPEAALMRKLGGQTVIVPFVEGFSTTSTIEKMRA